MTNDPLDAMKARWNHIQGTLFPWLREEVDPMTEALGRLVTTLTQDNFEVRDDGKPQAITQFDNTPRPIRLIVMLDVSGSMEGNLSLLRAAGAQLFSRLRADDVARVGAFGHEVTISPSFTHDADVLRAALPSPRSALR